MSLVGASETFIACAQPEALACAPLPDASQPILAGLLTEFPSMAIGTPSRDGLAQGMLTMAWLARVLTQWQPQARLRQFSARLYVPIPAKSALVCTGAVTDVFSIDGENRVTVRLAAVDEAGATYVLGEAVVALP